MISHAAIFAREIGINVLADNQKTLSAHFGGRAIEGIELPFHPDLTVPELTEVALPIPHPDPVDDVEGHHSLHWLTVVRRTRSPGAGGRCSVG